MKDEKSIKAKTYIRKYSVIYTASAVLCVLVAIALSLTVVKLTSGLRVPVEVPVTSTETSTPDTTEPPSTNSQNDTKVPATEAKPTGKLEIKTSSVGNSQVSHGTLLIVNENQTYDPSKIVNDVVVIKEQDEQNVLVTTWGIRITLDTFNAINQLQADMEKELQRGYIITLFQGFSDSDDTSEFATGLSFEIKFMKGGASYWITDGAVSKEYNWIKQNAWKYGLIFRYTEDKTLQTGHEAVPTQLRYVGKIHAKYMYDNKLCLEEYIDTLKDYTFNSPLELELDGVKSRAYYIIKSESDSTEVQFRSKSPVETYGSLTITGDNSDGFVIVQEYTEK